LIGILAIRA